VPAQSHELVKMAKRGVCVSCKGLRYRDWPKKRVALSEIAANQSRDSVKHEPFYRCKQCNVHLYKNRGCFNIFH
jgi:hypothetical protein